MVVDLALPAFIPR